MQIQNEISDSSRIEATLLPKGQEGEDASALQRLASHYLARKRHAESMAAQHAWDRVLEQVQQARPDLTLGEAPVSYTHLTLPTKA